MIKYFCDVCKKETDKELLHKIHPELLCSKYVELCPDCFEAYSKEMQKYIDEINNLENKRQEAIKRYFVERELYDEQK